MRLELDLPRGVEFYAGHAQSAALSPDGTQVAFVGVADGLRQIYLRRLDQFEPLRFEERRMRVGVSFPPMGALGFPHTIAG